MNRKSAGPPSGLLGKRRRANFAMTAPSKYIRRPTYIPRN